MKVAITLQTVEYNDLLIYCLISHGVLSFLHLRKYLRLVPSIFQVSLIENVHQTQFLDKLKNSLNGCFFYISSVKSFVSHRTRSFTFAAFLFGSGAASVMHFF